MESEVRIAAPAWTLWSGPRPAACTETELLATLATPAPAGLQCEWSGGVEYNLTALEDTSALFTVVLHGSAGASDGG